MFQDKSPEERLILLKDNCDAVEDFNYLKKLTSEELVKAKSDLAEVSIEISDIVSEKKQVMKVFAERLKDPADTLSHLQKLVKRRGAEVNEPCYKFIDHQLGTANYYNEAGERVSFRSLLPSEEQATIFNIHTQTGTNQ